MKQSEGAQTSIKGLIQSMNTPGIELLQGTVIQESPLKIQISSDDKLTISDRNTIVPWHLTDYETTATYTVGSGVLDSTTKTAESHTHDLATYTLTKGTITVYNALKTGDTVHVLALNNGKQYFVLDRVAS